MALPGKSEQNETSLRLPASISDVALSPATIPTVAGERAATGGELVAIATRNGAFVAELEVPRPRTLRVALPELAQPSFRLAFNRRTTPGRQLAVACGRMVYVVDLDVPGGGLRLPSSAAGGAAAAAGASASASTRVAGSAATAGGTSEQASAGEVTRCLTGHIRPVNALDWSPSFPFRLATCAEDCRCNIWDGRLERSAQTFLLPASWTTAVRWSPFNPTALATAHEDMVCLWDLRKGSQTIGVLERCQRRLIALDWSPDEQDVLMTASANYTSASPGPACIKIWNVEQQRALKNVSIENGRLGAACLLPRSAVFAAVGNEAAVISLQEEGKVLERFRSHDSAISAVSYAYVDAESFDGRAPELRLTAASSVGRCIRSWRYRLPQECKRSLAPGAAAALASSEGARASHRQRLVSEEEYLGCLARQSKRVRSLPCVGEVASFKQQRPNGEDEYELLIEVRPSEEIQVQITIGVGPAVLQEANKLRYVVDFTDEHAGSTDGPMCPGTVQKIFQNLTWETLRRDSNDLCVCVVSLASVLDRRNALPSAFEGVQASEQETQAGAEADPQPQPRQTVKRGATEEMPFPKTCGVCWSPTGELVYFQSLQGVQSPAPKHRWSCREYESMRLKMSNKQRKAVLDDSDEEDAAANAAEGKASLKRALADPRVKTLPAKFLLEAVESHWWTAAIPRFVYGVSSSSTIADVCSANTKVALSFGREDIAQVWRMIGGILQGDSGVMASAGRAAHARPVAMHLLAKIMLQLFDAQETLTLAVVGSVLLSAAMLPKVARTAGSELARDPKKAERSGSSMASRNSLPAAADCIRRPLSRSQSCQQTMNSHLLSTSATEMWKNPRKSLNDDLERGNLLTHPGRPTPLKTWAESTVRRDNKPTVPGLSYAKREKGPVNLIPKDFKTLEMLLHSVYAHCFHAHRLRCFGAFRFLIKLLHSLRDWHDMPILDVGTADFWKWRCPAEREIELPAELSAVASSSSPAGHALRRELPICAVCDLKVHKLYMPCYLCGHGFHIGCFKSWFSDRLQKCPQVGCECRCHYK
eukprot:TRINITY_DN4132_c0_g1_i1.p1 TRINITY_DN4132_c0_g1~~TRINITY_DN4132_c0_g1_i1.p1  ORF type:complete len:1048 (-),score=146.39 TRINITY_DN4132_c0_g1_i1:248-3391(-)